MSFHISFVNLFIFFSPTHPLFSFLPLFKKIIRQSNQFKMLAMYKTIFVVLAIGFTFDTASAESGVAPDIAEEKITAAGAVGGNTLKGKHAGHSHSPKGTKAPKSAKSPKSASSSKSGKQAKSAGSSKSGKGSKAPKGNKKGGGVSAKMSRAQVVKQAATQATAGVAMVAIIGFVAVIAVKKLRGDAVAAVVDEHNALLGLSEAVAAPSEVMALQE